MKYYIDRVNDILQTDGTTGLWVIERSRLVPLASIECRTFSLSDDLKSRLTTHYKSVPLLLVTLRGYTDEILS